MKTFVLILAVLTSTSSAFSQALNMTMVGHWDDNGLPTNDGLAFNDCWGYNAPNGTEVAILGALQRIYFFDVTNPADPEIIDFFNVQNQNGSTNSSIWRDFKTYGHYAYASADQGTSGLLIFDLQYVPDSVVLVEQTQAFWARTHNIWIDVDNGRLYAAGSNSNSNGTVVLDLEDDPEDPTQIGTPDFPYGYIHDIHVVNNIAYASHIYEQALSIYNFASPTNPILIRTLEDYPEPGLNHSSWLDASGNRLVFADESFGKALKLVNPNLINHQATNYHLFESQLIPNNPNSIAHNPFIKDDLCYVAYYHDGVQVFDISDTNNIVRVAYYDTYSNTNYDGYEGCWGVYPYLESGFIIASDISNGLFVLSLNEGVLPLNVIGFDASRNKNDAVLTWNVTSPEDGEMFFVEHSRDGIAFKSIGEIVAEKNRLNYQYTDTDPGPGGHFYRLTVSHLDGQRKPTAIRSLFFEMEDPLVIKPGIADDVVQVDSRVSGDITIIAADGRLLMSSPVLELERVEFNVSGFPAGQYFVVLHSGETKHTQSFVKS